MDWQPLSVREGRKGPSQLHDGVPDHLRQPIQYWLEGVFGYRSPGGMAVSGMLRVATATGIPVARTFNDPDVLKSIFAACDEDKDLYLDVIDAILNLGQASPGEVWSLRDTLQTGRSIFTVSGNGKSLQRRTDPTAEAALSEALAGRDASAEELSEAWEKAYGRDPDPSDAWDHAIKAVEAALVPIVCPRQDKPQLGHVLGQLSRQGDQWELALPGGDGSHSVEPLVKMLQLLWPNPDRHGSSSERRSPTSEEAEALVHLAVAIVQWGRKGILRAR